MMDLIYAKWVSFYKACIFPVHCFLEHLQVLLIQMSKKIKVIFDVFLGSLSILQAVWLGEKYAE